MQDELTITTQEHALLYDLLLTKTERKFLKQVRIGSRMMFGVGDIALRARAKAAEQGFPDFVALVIVGEEAGIGARRVSKLCNVAERFPEEIREKYAFFPFSVFEEAYAFVPSEDVQMLEYAREQMSDTQRWPGSEKIALNFRRQILGLELGLPEGTEKSNGNGSKSGVRVVTRAHEYSISPVSMDQKKWVAVTDLCRLIGKWKGRGITVEGCIRDIQKLIEGN